MKTWEIAQYSGEKFRRKSDGLIVTIDEDGTLDWQSGHMPLNIHDEWEKIKEPVKFMKAVEALNNGKTIYVVCDKHKETFSPMLRKAADWGYTTIQYQGHTINTDLILYGTWYIED